MLHACPAADVLCQYTGLILYGVIMCVWSYMASSLESVFYRMGSIDGWGLGNVRHGQIMRSNSTPTL